MDKVYKYTTSVVKNVLNQIISLIKITIHIIAQSKVETIDVYSSTCIDLNKENAKDPQFEVDDHVRISKCKKKFATDYVSNWSEKVFEITEVKNTVPWIDVTSDFNGEEIVGTFYKKELQKASQKECGI